MITPRSALGAALTLTVGLALVGCSAQTPSAGGSSPVAVSSTSPNGAQSSAPAAGGLNLENFTQRVTAAQLKAGAVHVSQVSETSGLKTTTEGS